MSKLDDPFRNKKKLIIALLADVIWVEGKTLF